MDRVGLAAIMGTQVLWASAFAGIRAGLQGYGPGHLALIRFLVASTVFALLAWPLHIPLPNPRDLPRILLAGLFGISIYHAALNFGETQVLASTASLIVAIVPAITAVLATFLLGERLNAQRWLGIAVGFAGVAIVSFETAGADGVTFSSGALWVLVAAVASAVFLVVEKPLMDRYPATAVTAYVTWSGLLFLLVFSPGLGTALANAPAGATWAAVYLGIFPAVIAYALLNVAMARAKASVVSNFIYMGPVLATLFAYLWLGEVPSHGVLIGGAVVIAGVALTSFARDSAPPAARRPAARSAAAGAQPEARSAAAGARRDL